MIAIQVVRIQQSEYFETIKHFFRLLITDR